MEVWSPGYIANNCFTLGTITTVILIVMDGSNQISIMERNQRGVNVRLLTKDLVRSVCEGDFAVFKKLLRLGADINCDLEKYTSTYGVLKRLVPFYTVGGMTERRRPMSLLAASTTLENTDITNVCVTRRADSFLKPLSSEDMLWVIEHSTLKIFEIMCTKFGESFVNTSIVFERTLPVMFEDGELQDLQTETVRTSPTRVMIDSLRIWRDVDTYYDTIARSKQSTQVRKLMCLVKTGGKLDWAGHRYHGSMSLLCTLITENEHYALDRLLNWKIITCATSESAVYVDYSVALKHRLVLNRILREPTMRLNTDCNTPEPLIRQAWISDILPHKAQTFTRILMTHNYVFPHNTKYILHANDTTKRVVHLHNAGVCISDDNDVLTSHSGNYDFTHPGLDVCIVKQIVGSNNTPRKLISIARLTLKTAIGPCKTGQLRCKLNTIHMPKNVKTYIMRI
jgi:hypothetical protein